MADINIVFTCIVISQMDYTASISLPIVVVLNAFKDSDKFKLLLALTTPGSLSELRHLRTILIDMNSFTLC